MLLDSGFSRPLTPHSPTPAFGLNPEMNLIRPFGAYALGGVTFWEQTLLAVDSARGYLLQVDPLTENTTVLNPYQVLEFLDATGLAVWQENLWFTQGNHVYVCDQALSVLATGSSQKLKVKPQLFVTLPYPADGVAVWESTVYVTCQKLGYILIFDRNTGRQITKFRAPGMGVENIAVRDEELWICDRTEQTVYCMDRATGEVLLSVLTPFENPVGLAFSPETTASRTLYVAYAGEEAYIRDNPNMEPSHELAFRDRTFIHPLRIHHCPEERYTLSNGYLIEVSYVEELVPLDAVHLDAVEWRIALPADTPRQKVRQIEPIGLPFTETVQDGQRVAVFHFDALTPHEGRIFGWRALLEVYSIKYGLTPCDVEKIPELPPEFQDRYLVDDDDLAMDTPIVQQAAREAIGTETNVLRQMLRIRDYVYDSLSYGIKPHIDTPDVVLERGNGSCGEYVGVLLALARLNGIACRTIGRYKCPQQAIYQLYTPVQPDYNHVWLEFYIPGVGWLPMESNPDDTGDGGPYPTRFFMGLAWYHIEIGKGISFEKVTSQGIPLRETPQEISIGDLAINHVRFKVLAELAPGDQPGEVNG